MLRFCEDATAQRVPFWRVMISGIFYLFDGEALPWHFDLSPCLNPNMKVGSVFGGQVITEWVFATDFTKIHKESEMQQIIGVTELQRKFRFFFDQVVSKRTSIILTRGSHPEAALIPYEAYLRFQQMQEGEVLAHFERVWNRLAEVNADFKDNEITADIKAV